MLCRKQKEVTVREAQASCLVWLGAAYDLVAANVVSKGDVLRVAQLAGVCGAKATSSLIPLCHNIHISKVDVEDKRGKRSGERQILHPI